MCQTIHRISSMEESVASWLMNQIELRTKKPELANFGEDTTRCDLEIIIRVAQEDREAFTEEAFAILKEGLSERTGVTPTIYLEGNEPEWLAKGDYI